MKEALENLMSVVAQFSWFLPVSPHCRPEWCRNGRESDRSISESIREQS